MRLVSNVALALAVVLVGAVFIAGARRRDDDTATWLALAATVMPAAGVAVVALLAFGDPVRPGTLVGELAVVTIVLALTGRLGRRSRLRARGRAESVRRVR